MALSPSVSEPSGSPSLLRDVIALRVVRGVNSFGLGLLSSSRTNLVYKILAASNNPTREQHQEVQSFQTRVAQLSTLVDFFLNPLIGHFMDRQKGNFVPTLVLSFLLLGIPRICLSLSMGLPSPFATASSVVTESTSRRRASIRAVRKTLFVINQIFTLTMFPKMMLAFTLQFGAMFGHGSREAVRQDQIGYRLAIISGLFGNIVGSRLFPYKSHPERAFLFHGTSAVLAAALLVRLSPRGGVESSEEQTDASDEAPVLSLRQRLRTFLVDQSPLMFGRSESLRALAVLLFFRTLPTHVEFLQQVYYRRKVGVDKWTGGSEDLGERVWRLALVINTCLAVSAMDLDSSGGPLQHAHGILAKVKIVAVTAVRALIGRSDSSNSSSSSVAEAASTGVVVATKRSDATQDFKRLMQQHALLEVVAHTGVAFAPSQHVLVLRYLLYAFHFGNASTNRLMQHETDRLGLGQGALSSATGNLLFIQDFVMPGVFNRLFQKGPDPYLVAAAAELVNCFVVVPWVYRALKRAAERTPIQEEAAA